MRSEAVARCAYCGKPLVLAVGRLQGWRASSGVYYCTEFCADDAEEAVFKKRGQSEAGIRRGT
jgi:hypothetical protein